MKLGIDELLRKDRLAQLLGIRIEEIREGYARVVMDARPEHCNGLGLVHGGTIFSLADTAFAAACNSHGLPTVGINATISYVKAAHPGVLIAEAQEVVDAKVGLCAIRVTNGKGELIAVFQGLSYCKQK